MGSEERNLYQWQNLKSGESLGSKGDKWRRLWFMREGGIGLGMEQKTGDPEKLVVGREACQGVGSPGLELEHLANRSLVS